MIELPHIEDPITEEAEIIPGLLPAKGQLVIAGETETGKSLTAIEICHTVLTSEALWGQLPVRQPVERVLYVLGEHYPATIRRNWLRMGLETPPGRFNLVGPDMLPDRALVADGTIQKHTVSTLLKWAEGRGLVVFDPLSSFVRGVDAENDNVVMRAVLETMTHITQKVGAACIVLAHAGKPQMVKGRETSRTKYLLRGASATEDAATNLFYLVAQEDDLATGHQRFDLIKRKYKGNAPDAYQLVRDRITGRQKYYASAKEFTKVLHEERRQRIEHAVDYFMAREGWTKEQAVEALAVIEKVTRRTIFRWLDPSVSE